MTTSKTIFLLILHVTTTTTHAQTFCPEANCPGSNIPIRFPFGLKAGPDNRCRYNSSFDLSCDDQNQLTITLPSGDFIVNGFDYEFRQISINDPGRCFPSRLLETNFTLDPPFRFDDFGPLEYTFLNCTPNVTDKPYVRDHLLVPVTCLSGENYTVAAIQTIYYGYVEQDPAPCSVVSEALVPVGESLPLEPILDGGDVVLTWYLSACHDCEMLGGTCGFVDDTGDDVGCSITDPDQPLPTQPDPPKGNRRWLIVSAGVPMATFVCLFLIFCTLRAKHQRTQHHSISLGANHNTTTTNNNGLDRSTIESYPKTVLLELRDSDNNTCSICLSEYKLGETIRTIPDCQHYFHVNCIDEWLRKSQTCPLCRNSACPRGSSSVNPSDLTSLARP